MLAAGPTIAKQRETGGEDRDPEQQRRPHAQRADQRSRKPGRDRVRDREGEEQRARLEDGRVADGLERGRHQHERDRGSPVRRRRHPGPEAERGGPGHAPRDERVAVAASREQHRADPRTENERHQRARRTPTARRRVLQPADDERDRERQCAESPRVEGEPTVGRDVRHERRQRDEGHDTERDVDGEEAAPRPGRGQSTGDERADRAADPAGRAPQTDREPATVGVEDHVDDRQRRRETARRRDALQGASDEQHGEVARDRTDRGRRGEQDDADEQEAARRRRGRRCVRRGSAAPRTRARRR